MAQHPLVAASVTLWADSAEWAAREVREIEGGLQTLPTVPTPEAREALIALAARIGRSYAMVSAVGGEALHQWYLDTTHRIANHAEALFAEPHVFNRPRWTLIPKTGGARRRR
jgi:hypothetical protein